MFTITMFRDSISGPKVFWTQEAKTLIGAKRVAAKMAAQYPVGSEVVTSCIPRSKIMSIMIHDCDLGTGKKYA